MHICGLIAVVAVLGALVGACAKKHVAVAVAAVVIFVIVAPGFSRCPLSFSINLLSLSIVLLSFPMNVLLFSITFPPCLITPILFFISNRIAFDQVALVFIHIAFIGQCGYWTCHRKAICFSKLSKVCNVHTFCRAVGNDESNEKHSCLLSLGFADQQGSRGPI